MLTKTFSPGFKRFLLIIALFFGISGLRPVINSCSHPSVYDKDFISPYLMAKAMLAGVNPYLPLSELAARWLPDLPHDIFPHPTPHTPTLGLLCLPLALFEYQTAARIWLAIELGCLLASAFLLLRWWGTPLTARRMILVCGFALGWPPITSDLMFGQLNLPLLAILFAALLALRDGKDVAGGAMLGALFALKLMGWPVVIFLALRRRWRGVVAAGAVAVAANLLAMAVIGSGSVRDYYLKVGPQVAAHYHSNDLNFSAWTVGARLFSDFGFNYLTRTPWPSATLDHLLTYAAPLVILLGAIVLALKVARFDAAFALLAGASIILSPVAWPYYLVLALIPIAVAIRSLQELEWPRNQTLLALGLCLLISLRQMPYVAIASAFADRTAQAGIPVIPFAVGLLSLLPAVEILGLLWLVWRVGRMKSDSDLSFGSAQKVMLRVE
ncbi:MAG: glycosyltransferase family 87 protein [Blastocatellales bacterium]